MRIGIDETGTFNPTSNDFHFIMAVLPRRGGVERFLPWEATIDDPAYRDNGEVKGRLLTDDQLAAFVDEILYAPPVTRIRPTSLKPSQNPRLREHQRLQVERCQAAAERVSKAGDEALAQKTRVGATWLRNLSIPNYVWLVAMSKTISTALYDLIIDAHHGWYDSELADIRVLIDERFIKAQGSVGADMAVSMAYSYLMTDVGKPRNRRLIHTLDRMAACNHPFAQRHFNAVENPWKQWHFRPLFEQACDFSARSRHHPEVRIADLTATVYSRVNKRAVGPRLMSAFEKCQALVGSGAPATHTVYEPLMRPLRRLRANL